MAANNSSWPQCGCAERCSKPKCMHAGGRELTKEAAHLSVVGRKNSPERMTQLLDRIMKFPEVVKGCLFVGITYPTLRYWLKRSEEGRVGDGFDLTYGEETKRFHQHFEDARDTAVQMVDDAYQERALHGYYEVLHYQGHVRYQYDEKLLNLGLEGPEAYLRDEHGKPIPERIQMQDPEVMLQVLKAWRRDRYGAREQIDVTHRGGVLVVGVKARDSKELESRERSMVENPIDVEFRELPEPGAEHD